MKSGITFLAILVSMSTLSGSANAAFDGHGLGSGNGFPRVKFEQEQLKVIPDLKAMQEVFVKIAAQVPSLGYRLNLLAQKFGSDDKFKMIHFKGNYPYQYANSESWPVLDEWGIPLQARITIWNDYYTLSASKRVEILLHEMIHILVTESHEDETQELTSALMSGDLSKLSSDAESLLQASIQKVSEKSTQVHQRAVLEYYLTARDLPTQCSELKNTVSVKIGEREFQFPDPSDETIVRLRRDSALSRGLLVECLQKTPEGSSLVKGFFDHPYFRQLFVRAITGGAQVLRVELQGRGRAEFVTRFSEVLNGGLRKVSVTELEAKIPGFSDWLRIQRGLLAGEIAATPMTWTVTHMIQTIGDAIPAGENRDTITQVKVFRSSSKVSYNDWPSLIVE